MQFCLNECYSVCIWSDDLGDGGGGDFRENIELLIFVHHDAKSGPSTARNYY